MNRVGEISPFRSAGRLRLRRLTAFLAECRLTSELLVNQRHSSISSGPSTVSKSVLWPLVLWCVSCASEAPDNEASTAVPAALTPHQEAAEIDIGAIEPFVEAISWHRWPPPTASALASESEDKPILIYLAAPGCDGLFANAGSALQMLVEERFIPIRVNPFHHPHVARRYGNAGWPALAVLHPDGRLISSATDIPPRNVRIFLRQTLKHLGERRQTIESKLRRATAAPAAGKPTTPGSLFAAIAADFDTLHGGFGTSAKFPEPLVLQFLVEYGVRRGDEAALDLARRSLDALLKSPVWDDKNGGTFIYSLTRDWLTPVYEKDSLDQAALLRTLIDMIDQAKGGSAPSLDQQSLYEQRARQLLSSCLSSEFYDEKRGVYAGRRLQLADGTWWTDPAVYADRNGLAISTALRAAAVLDDEASALKALAAARFLMANSIGEEGEVVHCLNGGDVLAPGLLADQILVALALKSAFKWSGESEFASAAAAVQSWAEANLLDPATGSFHDSRQPPTAGAGWRSMLPFEDGNRAADNVIAARLYAGEKEMVRAADILNRAVVPAAGRSFASLGTTLLRLEGR
jgi:uncharacterized protein YyaL (SSP411 family)